MRITFTQTMSDDRQAFLAGQTYDVHDDHGRSAVKNGVARLAKPGEKPAPHQQQSAPVSAAAANVATGKADSAAISSGVPAAAAQATPQTSPVGAASTEATPEPALAAAGAD